MTFFRRFQSLFLQDQHLNSNIAKYTDFEYKRAVKENNTAVAIVKKVIQHYKDQKKILYLIGIPMELFWFRNF